MSKPPVHDTIAISKKIKTSVERVFSAWEDPTARSQWGPPTDSDALEFLENDFRIGGLDVHRCGQKDDLRFRVETRYYEINKPYQLLFTERVLADGAVLSASLISVAMNGKEDVTALEVTIQVASLVGADMIDGTRNGWMIAIDQLADICEVKAGDALQ